VETALPAPECVGILQVHPTRLCNLACAHCYSTSSPSARTALPPERIAGAIRDAAALGFNVVSLSGGEPLVYEGLEDVVRAAREVGSRVNIVSNGLLIRSSRYERLAGCFGIVALSLDGLPERHNAIRGSKSSFESVRAAAAELRRSRQAFGIIHTLCSESMRELEALTQIASDWGASLLQLHPFERAGRGASAEGMSVLSEEERLDALLLAAVLQGEFPHLRIQLDLVHRDVARRLPAAIHGAPLREPMTPRELVLQDDGRIVPLAYGIDRAWTVADLSRERLSESWPSFIETRWLDLRRRLRRACVAIARGRHGEVVAWHAVMRAYAGTGARPRRGLDLAPPLSPRFSERSVP
jgi:MoaA/NifB/PqqE/SkfB family radical SAM enzyme